MTRRSVLLTVLLLVVLIATTATAQDTPPTATPVDPNAHVSWPPPVYVLRGEVDIRGTANLANMSNYFIEFRPLGDDLSVPNENAPWFPATLPSRTPVIDDVLGAWNTATAPDGVYELRLTINIAGRVPFFYYVSPLRIENNPPPWVDIGPTSQPTAQPTLPPSRPTLQPTPTAPDTSPRVTALVDANVRRGDSTIYERVGTLLTGQTAAVIGLSTSDSGWYYIQLPDGTKGWIAPSIVSAEGNLRSVPRINPPPPPFTPTPLPTATPIASGNLIITGFELLPATPNCDQAFTVRVNISNIGSQPTQNGGTLLAQDVHLGTGTPAGSGSGTFPVIQPGGNWVVSIPMLVSTYYAEVHQITLLVDSLNEVAETNEGDNTTNLTYTLAKAACP